MQNDHFIWDNYLLDKLVSNKNQSFEIFIYLRKRISFIKYKILKTIKIIIYLLITFSGKYFFEENLAQKTTWVVDLKAFSFEVLKSKVVYFIHLIKWFLKLD